ncbi:MAG: large repetitive protein, partial [Thermoanaerobaculia bacterium]|nr:large repetitive protein [Thermoanaerobaculia bacterium]
AAPVALFATNVDLRVVSVTGSPNPITLNTGNITYTVQLFNAESTTAGTSPVLTSTIPSSSTYVSSSATGGGSCSPSAGTVTCNWPTIPASNNFFVTIVVTPTAGGSLTLSSSVSGADPDPTPANNSGSGSVTVNDQIDLRIVSVTGSPNPITLNTGNITYTTQLFNNSTSQGTGTVLTMTIPSASTFVSASVTGGGSCSQSAGVVTCNWTSIGASVNYFATVVVTPTAGGSLTLSASASGTEPDSNNANNSGSGSVTVNDQIDLRIVSVTGSPNPITLNTGNITYTTQLFNNSTSQGTGTVLTMTIPSASTFVSASVTGGGSCSQSAGVVTCNWTSIGASVNYFATVVVTPTAGGSLTLSASASGTEPDSNNANNSGSGSVTVNDQIDLRIVSVTGSPNPITLNTGNVTYTTQLFNNSTSQGTGTVLTMTIPSASTFVSASVTGGGSCSQSAGVVTCNWTSIGASVNYFATVVVTPTAGGSLTLSASASGTEPDSNNANNSGSGSATVNDHIDLRIVSVTGSPNPITLNTGNVTYTTQLFNNSTSQGTGTVLTMTIPSASTFVSASVTGGGSCSQSAGVVTCNWTSIGASVNYFATVVVTPTAGGTATLSASASGTEPDSNNANNSGSGSVTVNDQIDLRIVGISGTPDPITFAGGNVTFTIQLFNNSTSQGTNPVLTVTLPSNSTYVSSTPTNSGTCTPSAGTVTCSWSSIGASVNFFPAIVVTPTIPGTLTLSASASGTQPDPNSANNSASKTTTVTPTSCTAIPSGAVAWYRAQNNGVDSIGPNFATANGSAAYATGEVGQAFALNGTTAYVSAPDNASLHPASLTIEGFFKISGTTGIRMLASKSLGTGVENSFLVFIAADGTMGAGVGDGTSTDMMATTTAPTTGVWHHFAYVYDSAGTAQALYLDGALINAATTSKVIAYDTNPLLIGAQSDNSTLNSFFSGGIDELTIYNRALSATEIQTIFGAGTFGKCYVAAPPPAIAGFTPGSGIVGTNVVITGTD